MADVEIAELWVYPVKSLGGARVDSAGITAAGSLVLDREWIVADRGGHAVWQGDIPAMTLVGVALSGGQLVFSRAGEKPFPLRMEHAGAPALLTMYKQQFTGIDAGDEVAGWLSDALGAPLRLVRIGEGAHGWRGLNPVHIVSRPSLRALNDALAAGGESTAVVQRNFRPNVVLDGAAPAWFEEGPAVFDFGEARLRLREPCVRCELPNISLVDASRKRQPLKLIGRMAKARPTAAPASFGTYAAAEGDVLREGMRARFA